MINLESVGYSYGDGDILADVSLRLAPNSFHFLTGPSGAGKSTFLKLCYAELTPKSGTMQMFGMDVVDMSRDDIAAGRQRIGIVHQNCQFLDHLTVTENVTLPLEVAGRVVSAGAASVDDLIAWVGLQNRAQAHPQELSGGERQRLALARAVVMSPDVILADEPTGNVDWDMSLRILQLLVELNKLGKAVLFATHDLNLIRTAKKPCFGAGAEIGEQTAAIGGRRSMRILRAIWAFFFASDNGASRVVPPTGFTARLTVFSAAAMAFLAVFALAFSLASARLATVWSSQLAQTSTIRISAPEDQVQAQAIVALKILETTPGVTRATIMSDADQRALLEPWFGPDLPLDTLPIPTLIEIEETRDGYDTEGLRLRLAADAPGAVLDDHTRWRQPVVKAAGRLRLLGLISVALIVLTTGAIITLAAQSALVANAREIEVLRLIGALDSFIARAFVRRFTRRAGLGAAAGTIVGAAAVAALPVAEVEAGFLTGFGFQGFDWLWLVLIPPLAAFMAFWATRSASIRMLRSLT